MDSQQKQEQKQKRFFSRESLSIHPRAVLIDRTSDNVAWRVAISIVPSSLQMARRRFLLYITYTHTHKHITIHIYILYLSIYASFNAKVIDDGIVALVQPLYSLTL